MASASLPPAGTSIFSNYSWSLVNLALSKGLRFAAIVLCIRRVGMEGWGEVAAALVAVTFLGFAVDQGLSGAPQAYRVGERDLDWPLVKAITRHRLLVALALVAALHFLGPSLAFVPPLAATYAWVLVPRALSIEWLFHRRERYHLTLGINMVRMVTFFALVHLVVEEGGTAMSVIAAEMAAEVAGIAYSYAMLGRLDLAREGAAGRVAMRPLLAFSLPVMVTGVMDTALGSADILVLRHLRGSAETGQYDMGGKIGMTYFFLGATLIQIILPKLARLHAAGDLRRIDAILAAAGKVLLILGTALLIPSFYYSEELVSLLFGRDYPITVFVFKWIPVWVYATPLTMLNITLLLALGHRREYMAATVLAAAVNVAANYLLIGALGGAGAVFARFVSEAFLLVYTLARLPREYRAGRVRGAAIFAANLALQVGLFRLHEVFGHREAFLALSLAAFAGMAVAQRVLSRETLETLLRN